MSNAANAMARLLKNTSRGLTKEQFSLLFDTNGIAVHKYHAKLDCLCRISSRHGINLHRLDITLTYCILKNCENLGQPDEQWIVTIKDERNNIVHKTETKTIAKQAFQSIWFRV